jgi:flagellin-like protein
VSTKRDRGRRGQASIIGVAVLVTVTVISIGALTMAAGTFVEDSVAAANTQRVADDLAGIGENGDDATRIEFSRGTLRVEPRSVRLLRGERSVVTVEADALVYESRGRRVAAVGGLLVEGQPGRARLRGPLPVVVGEDRLLVDVVALNTSGPDAVGGSSPVSVTVRTNATHEYRAFEESQYAIAVETTTPKAWERAFATAGVELSRRDFDEDGVPSVVATVPDPVTVDLAIHDLRAVVRRG